MKRLLLALGLLFSTTVIFSTTPGTLDTDSFNSSASYPPLIAGIVTTDIGSGSQDNAYASAIQPDGKLVVAGSTYDGGSTTIFAVTRYNIDGSLDGTFGSDGIVTTNISNSMVLESDIARGVAIQNDGKIVVVGSTGSPTKFVVARYLTNGSLDTATFNSGASGGDIAGVRTITFGTTSVANAVAIQSNGYIVIAGSTTSSTTSVALARLDASGNLDTGGFGTGGKQTLAIGTMLSPTVDVANALAIDSNQFIVIAGSSGTSLLVARFDTTGALDASGFNTTGYNVQAVGASTLAVGYAVGFQSTGKIIVTGKSDLNAVVVRFTTSGLLDSGASAFGTGGTPIGYNAANKFGYTSAVAYGLVIQSDDKIVIGGTALRASLLLNDFLIARYAANGSILDTSFGSSGFTTTNLDGAVASPDNGRSITALSNGGFMVVGSTSSNGTDFAVARYVGDAPAGGGYGYDGGGDGDSDTGYNGSGYESYPTDTNPSNHPKVTSLQILSGDAMYVATTTTTNSQIVQLNSNGTTASTYASIGQTGAVDVIVDSHGRALVVGTNGTPRGWLTRYYDNSGVMTIDSTFNSGSVLVNSSSTSYSRVCEQKSGRIIVMGQTNSGADGILVAYNQDGTIDTETFGSSGVYTALTGAILTDMVIDSSDEIYVVYQVTGGDIEISKITATGSGLDATYATGVALDTGLLVAQYGAPSIALDNSGRILLTAVCSASDPVGDIEVIRYTTGGLYDTAVIISQSTSLLNGPVITHVQSDATGHLVIGGYEANYFFIARLKSDISGLDTAFAPYAVVPGIFKTVYNASNPTDATTPKRVLNTVAINSSGVIVYGGYENVDSTHATSVLGAVNGGSASQVARYSVAKIGQIDATFGASGAFDIHTLVSVGTAGPIYVLDSGKVLVTVVTSGNTILAQLALSSPYNPSAPYTLDTASFGSTTGKVTLTGLAAPRQIMVDTTGNIYIVADSKLAKVTSAGVLVGGFGTSGVVSTTVTKASAVLQQRSGRILVAGKTVSSGVFAAYDPINGSLDTDFGVGGYYAIADGFVSAAAVQSGDKIVFAHLYASSDAIVDRLFANGSGLDGTFSFGTPISGVSAEDQIALQFDKDGKIVVVANTTENFTAVRYLSTGADEADPVAITPSGVITSPSLLQIITLTASDSNVDGATLVLAADAMGNTLEMFRLTPGFTQDTNFAYNSSFLETGLSPITNFVSMDVTADKGILVLSNSNTPWPYLARVYDDYVVTKINQDVSSLSTVGTLDTDFNEGGTDAGFINLNTELGDADVPTTYASKAKVIVQLSDGSYLVATDDGHNTYINKFTSDDVALTSGFGTSGLLTITGEINVASLFIDQDGNLLVAGGSGGLGSDAGWLKKYDSTGTVIDGFAPTITLDQHTVIAQQSDGRYIVGGFDGSAGAFIAYNCITGAVDTTFGDNGIFLFDATVVTTLAIDEFDNIFTMVLDTSDPAFARIAVIDPNGGNIIRPPSITGGSDACDNASNHLVVDASGDIVAITVATGASPYHIFITRYSYDGPDASFISFTSGPLDLATAATGLTTPVITSMVVDANGKFVVTGYDATGSVPFVMRIKSDLTGLDTTFNSAGAKPGVEKTTIAIHSGDIAKAWYNLIITEEGKVKVAGYAAVDGTNTPYLMSLNGDDFIGQYTTTVDLGTPGTLNENFNHYDTYPGMFGLGALDASILHAKPKALLPQANGDHYIVFDNGKLILIDNYNQLDTTNWNPGEVTHPAGFAVNDTQTGAFSMMMDGKNRLVVAGTNSTDAGHGWIARYTAGTAGTFDATFNGGAYIDLGNTTVATIVVEQTCGRLVVAGQDADGNGILFGFTNTGLVDTTFGTDGVFNTGFSAGVYGLICDQYDRLILATADTGAGAVYVQRLTESGELDTTFGAVSADIRAINGGAGILQNADDETQVRIAFDSAGNIVVAAHQHTEADFVSVVAYDNVDGGPAIEGYVEGQLDITSLTVSTLTSLITSSDGKVLISGYQSGSDDMWVARVKDSSGNYILDSAFGDGDGIMTFHFDPSIGLDMTNRTVSAIAIYGDGEISIIGSETDTSVITPFIARAYNNPFTSQESQSPNSELVGTNDTTFGVSELATADLGITFFGASGNSGSLQTAQAVAMQDNNSIVIAIDGGTTADTDTPSQIMLNMFDVDGLVATFGSHTIVSGYASTGDQHVCDMMTFTADGVYKAIVAGYVANSGPTITNSLLMQYNLSTPGLDTAFGGFDSNPQGIACGDAQIAQVVGRQSNGRIVVGGLDQANHGLLFGYTPAGQLDASFGLNGLVTQGTSAAGVYSHAIDSKDRIVIVYTNITLNHFFVKRFLPDGNIDPSFGVAGIITSPFVASSLSNLRVAVDGSNNVIVAACTATAVSIYSYAAADGSPLHVALVTSFTTPAVPLSNFTIARLLLDADGKIIVVGSDASTPNKMVVIRALADLSNLDTTFNPNDTAGYLKYQVASASTQNATDALIHNDGRIIIVGSGNGFPG